MMRSPYESPKKPPAQRFLRRRPTEKGDGRRLRLILLGAGAVAAYLVYTFILSDTGILRIAALKRENETLRAKKIELAVRVNDLERRRKEQARDPLLEERVARERFHLVKKDEILYRYKSSPDSGR
ncbi:MAG TPA: septum formation initiator family protein [Candidatus Eisenbacteria bacterium]|nr:septum formation initiator family protein [Candidatus Eisenbacteria bacterium]